MSIKLCCCLISFALISHVAADFGYIGVIETQQISLRCHELVKGDATWSREKDGSISRIITISGDEDKKHTNDPRYYGQTDKALVIREVKFSDSGRYYCNNEPAAELTVIPSGTKILRVNETERVTLECLDEESEDSKWSRLFGEMPQRRFKMKDQKLIIKDAKQEDTGLYYCGGKPAVFLKVIQRSTSEFKLHHWLIVVGALIFIIIIITACFIWRQKCKKQEAGTECHVYDEITQGSRLQPNSESPYSLIGPSPCSGNDQGSSLPANSTYFLLDKPKAPTNPDDQL